MGDNKINLHPTSSDEDVGKGKMDELEMVETASIHGSMADKSNRAPELVRNLSPETREILETKLRRKIDARLMPLIIIMYILNYLDRNNIAAARLAGLEKDLKLVGNQFQVRCCLKPSYLYTMTDLHSRHPSVFCSWDIF